MKKQKQKQTFSAPLLLLIAGSILLAAGASFYLLDRPPPVADVPDDHGESGLPYPQVTRIPLVQAKNALDQGTAVIVDVRSSGEYAEAHIPNAISIPLPELETRYRELSPEDEIIIYCS